MNRLICSIILSSMALLSHATEPFPEPFGLSWDLSEKDLKKIGFSPAGTPSSLKTFTSKSAPKAWSKAEAYIAITHKGKLIKVVAISTNISDDIYGTEGKDNFNKISTLLRKKYGEPTTEFHHSGLKLYDETDEFYQCLEYSGCGVYMSIFKFGGGTIGVQLNGRKRGTGYITISYESPRFNRAKDEIEQEKEKSDNNAF